MKAYFERGHVVVAVLQLGVRRVENDKPPVVFVELACEMSNNLALELTPEFATAIGKALLASAELVNAERERVRAKARP